jgi:thiamine-monophosphate kinase
MKDKEFINIINDIMPRSTLQVNKPFETDSEVMELKHDRGYLLFSTDEFSAEDMLVEQDAFALGYNIAVGSLSDIYASGGVPKYYAQSLTINGMFTTKYLKNFHKGVATVLKQANVAFIGGDFGKSSHWRCTSSVIGFAEKIVRRSGAKVGDNVYITGKIGAGNMQALKMKTRFALRNAEAEIIRQNATSCIDTSDGVWNAINLITAQSKVGYELHDLPYETKGLELSEITGFPKEMLFFCEGGEFELLFTSPRELPFYKIGHITERSKTLEGKDISEFDLCAREFERVDDYIKAVKKTCDELL